MKVKSQFHVPDQSYSFDSLAWVSPEITVTFAFGLTNKMSLQGKTPDEGGDWETGIFGPDEWGEGFFAQYGFQQKRGWFLDSALYLGPTKTISNLRYDRAYCTDHEKSCTVEFSRELDVHPKIETGQEYLVLTATNSSLAPEDWLAGVYTPITFG